MTLADVLVEGLGGGELLVAGLVVGVPAAGKIVVGRSRDGSTGSASGARGGRRRRLRVGVAVVAGP